MVVCVVSWFVTLWFAKGNHEMTRTDTKKSNSSSKKCLSYRLKWYVRCHILFVVVCVVSWFVTPKATTK